MGKLMVVFLTGLTAAALSLVLMVGAADAAAPGDPFYAVDRQIEAMQLKLTGSPGSRLELQARLTAERMAELQEVAARGDLIHFNEALTALEQSVVEVEAAAAEESLTPQAVSALIDRALTHGAALDENENENDNDGVNENENANDGDDNANDNGNVNDGGGDDNANDNANSNDNDNANTNDTPPYKHPRTGGSCGEARDDSHPAAAKLGANYGVGSSEVMDWFCGGYGFGEIALAYKLAQLNGIAVDEIFQLRSGGMGWGLIMQQYGLIGKNKPPKNNGKQNGKTQPTPVVGPPPAAAQPTPAAPGLQGKQNPVPNGLGPTNPGGKPPVNPGGGNKGGNGNGNGGGNGGGNNKGGGGKKP